MVYFRFRGPQGCLVIFAPAVLITVATLLAWLAVRLLFHAP
jgi:hypothetical protein